MPLSIKETDLSKNNDPRTTLSTAEERLVTLALDANNFDLSIRRYSLQRRSACYTFLSGTLARIDIVAQATGIEQELLHRYRSHRLAAE